MPNVSISSQKIIKLNVTFAKNVHQDPIEGKMIAYGKGSLATTELNSMLEM